MLINASFCSRGLADHIILFYRNSYVTTVISMITLSFVHIYDTIQVKQTSIHTCIGQQ